MRLKIMLLVLLAITTCLTTLQPAATANRRSDKLYQQMTPAERTAFVSAKARSIAREMSGNDYQFTPAFEATIQKHVDSYVQRIESDQPGRGTRSMFERGQPLASTFSGIFKKHKVSPLIGLYHSGDRIGVRKYSISEQVGFVRHVSVHPEDRRAIRIDAQLTFWTLRSRLMPPPDTSLAT